MFRNPKQEQRDRQIKQDLAALLRKKKLIAVRRPDGQIAFLPRERATPEQLADALDPETVIRREGLFDPSRN
jgi:hypothetical protein